MVAKAGKNKTKKTTKTKRTLTKTPVKSTAAKKATTKSNPKKSPAKKNIATKSPTKQATAVKASATKAGTKSSVVSKSTISKIAATKSKIPAKTIANTTASSSTTTNTNVVTKSTATKPKLTTVSKNVSLITNISNAANNAVATAAPKQITESKNLLMRHKFLPYSPKNGEQYMNEIQKRHFRSILENWKHELMEEVDQTIHELKEAGAGTTADLNDRASQEENFNLELRTRDRERKLIKKIEEAIAMLDDGEYGYCEACGDEIGIKRLEARPTALLCIDCKTLDEIREKRS